MCAPRSSGKKRDKEEQSLTKSVCVCVLRIQFGCFFIQFYPVSGSVRNSKGKKGP